MRDDTKSMEFYKKIYEQDSLFIEDDKGRIQRIIDIKGSDFHTIPSCYAGISYDYFHRFYLSYTMGMTYEELLPDVEKYIENGIKSCDGEPYEDMEYLIYVTLIFGLDKFKDSIKEKILQHTGYQDKYMEELYQLLEPEFPITTEKIYWEKDCKPLDEVINLSKTDKVAATKKLKDFMNGKEEKTIVVKKG